MADYAAAAAAPGAPPSHQEDVPPPHPPQPSQGYSHLYAIPQQYAVQPAAPPAELSTSASSLPTAAPRNALAVAPPQPPPPLQHHLQQQQHTASTPSSPLSAHSSLRSPPLPTDQYHLDILNHPVSDVLTMISALLQRIIEANDVLYMSHHPHAAHHPHHPDAQRSNFASSVLAFHGRNVPAISLHSYLTRILKYCPATNEVFLSLLVYFDRISKRTNAPTEYGADESYAGAGAMLGASSSSAAATPLSFAPAYAHASQQTSVTAAAPASPTSSIGSGQPVDVFVMDSYNVHRLVIAGVTVASKFFSDVFYKNSRYAKVGGLPLEELNHLELQFLLLCDFRLAIPLEELQRYGNLLLQFWEREASSSTQHREQPLPQQQQKQQEE
ncbi:cyclin-domain-containing protein [Limtongia smithiae]|uniref:cyclin-domain-containing protein n=1 Tax=Limtongia smithiae TaxID=1125753 RepID=UPI0034CE97A2